VNRGCSRRTSATPGMGSTCVSPDDPIRSVSPELRSAIELMFSVAEAETVALLLPSQGELPPTCEFDRVLLSILRLSEGDVERLRHFADVARRDWRDVVLWAETPRHEGEPTSWPELRRRLGLDRRD
jgi:hypothetical protein